MKAAEFSAAFLLVLLPSQFFYLTINILLFGSAVGFVAGSHISVLILS
jgi:hypothetical protein